MHAEVIGPRVAPFTHSGQQAQPSYHFTAVFDAIHVQSIYVSAQQTNINALVLTRDQGTVDLTQRTCFEESEDSAPPLFAIQNSHRVLPCRIIRQFDAQFQKISRHLTNKKVPCHNDNASTHTCAIAVAKLV